MTHKIDDKIAAEWRKKERLDEYEDFQIAVDEYRKDKHYYIIEQITRQKGQSGDVFFALDKQNHIVAIKQTALSKVKASNPSVALDYYREERNIETLYYLENAQRCLYIADLLDHWTTKKTERREGDIFIVTEYIKHPFEKIPVMYAKNQLPLEAVVNTFIKLCEGLEHIHKNLVHRDIKPDNIRFYIKDGIIIPKIIDFGLACGLDTSLTIMGTPGYRSPERIRQNYGVGVDIYPMGIMLWEALNGYKPFKAKTVMEERYQTDDRLRDEFEQIDKNRDLGGPDKEEIKRKRHLELFIQDIKETGSPYLTEVIKKAIQPEEANRYASATELKQNLQLALYGNRLDELLSLFEKINGTADHIKNARIFDMYDVENIDRLKADFFREMHEKQGISDMNTAHLMGFFRQRVGEKMKPVIDATRNYLLRRLNLKPLDLQSEKDLYEAYRQQIDKLMEPLAAKRNVLDMASRLKRLYRVCELNDAEL